MYVSIKSKVEEDLKFPFAKFQGKPNNTGDKNNPMWLNGLPFSVAEDNTGEKMSATVPTQWCTTCTPTPSTTILSQNQSRWSLPG